MRFMQIESVLQTVNRSEPAKNRFSVALLTCTFPYLVRVIVCFTLCFTVNIFFLFRHI